jgi:GT2 family glycosyltransferase
MATQIVQVDARAAATDVVVRDDVQQVLVVVMSDGRPVALSRLPRPSNGRLAIDGLRQDPSVENPVAALRPAASPPVSMTIVVCTHERPDDLTRCLESLTEARQEGHEILVVDNAPSSGRTEAAASHFEVRYVVEPHRGLNRARNRALRESTREVIAFVDDDVVASPNWAAAMSLSFGDATVACVTGLVLPLELETAGQEQFELYSQPFRRLEPREYTRDVFAPSASAIVGVGANMAFVRDRLLAIGGFDERFDGGTRIRAGGDSDAFARLLDAGEKIAYRPEVMVWHRHRRSMREVRDCVFGYGIGTYSLFMKRLLEQRDLGAVPTAARWFAGAILKRAYAGLTRQPAPGWRLVLTGTAGAVFAPWCFGYETWRRRRDGMAAA